MEIALLAQNFKKTLLQRNILLLISAILLTVNAFLALLLTSKSEHTIIVPASLQGKVEITKNNFSASYIEEMSAFFTHLLLDLSPNNIDQNTKILLGHVAPEYYHKLQNQLIETKKRYEKYNLVTSFDITKITQNGLEAHISGVLHSRFASEQLQEQNLQYLIKYKRLAGRLLITEFISLAGKA